jgi:hypothetical protein
MNDSDRQWMFPQMLDYICGQSNLIVQWPKWTMKDIEDFWSMKWKDGDAADRA